MTRPLLMVPALDLRGGRCVRLERGDPARETRYDDDPVARARAFVAAGARALHLVDLDGAFGDGENQSALADICRAVDVPVQTGGGVRVLADVAARLDAGAAAVVIGSLLVDDPIAARTIAETFGDRVVAGIDARGERVATRGWQRDGGVLRDDLVREVARWGIGRVVYTEIDRDGMGSGYDIAALAHVAGLSAMHVTASGGAKTLNDLVALREGTPANVDRAIVGKAIYDGTIDVGEAIAELVAGR